MVRSILSIIKKRSVPGLLVFDGDYRLLYFNREALEILSGGTPEPQLEGALPQVPEQVLALCTRLRSDCGERCETMDAASGEAVSLRASYLGTVGEGYHSQHILVLIEKISEERQIDLESVQKEFQFSRKELEVLRHICKGLPNRVIAETMFISEHTVKNHIKKIMRRMRVKSRSQILVGLR